MLDKENRALKKSFVDRAFRYIRVMETNSMHTLSSVYFVNQCIHVSGISVAHHLEVYCIYTAIGACCAFRRPTDSQLKTTARTNFCSYKIIVAASVV